MSKLEELYKPAYWEIPEDFLSFGHFQRVCLALNKKASPGVPLMYSTPTVGAYLGWDGVSYDARKLESFWVLVQQQINTRSSDPIRMFIKREPHKQKKLVDGRLRLISSVSLVDQVIDHMLFDNSNNAQIGACMKIPSKPGWAPYQGGWQRIQKLMPAERYLSVDKSNWDWAMPIWAERIDLELRARLCLNFSEGWYDLACWRYDELYSRARLMLSNGEIYLQKTTGLQKSGAVVTISMNSVAQVAFHLVACRRAGIEPDPRIFSMGDDTTQPDLDYGDEYFRELEGLGCQVKEKTVSEEMEFAGHRIGVDGAIPLYSAKHYFALLHADPDVLPDMLESYQRLYACRPDILGIIHRLMRVYSPGKALSRSYLRDWYDGFIT